MNRRSAHNARRITTPHQPPRRSARSSHQDVPPTAGSVGVESRQKLTEASAVGQFDDLDMRVSCERCVETWTRVSPVVPDPPLERELETFGASVSLDRLAMFLRCSPQRRGQAREATPRHDDDGVSASESLVNGPPALPSFEVTATRANRCAEAHVDAYAANVGARAVYERHGFGARSISRADPPIAPRTERAATYPPVIRRRCRSRRVRGRASTCGDRTPERSTLRVAPGDLVSVDGRISKSSSAAAPNRATEGPKVDR